jgi:flagellar protein FlaE
MTMNPNDYDPNELRNAGEDPDGMFLGDSGRDVNDGPGPLGADEVLQSNQYRELFLLEQVSGDGSMEKPYLDSLPRSYAAELVVFEWL